jgi:molecular chaperone DnaK
MPQYGIDLGTTYSAIGLYEPQRHGVTIADMSRYGAEQTLRSVVYYPSDGKPVVGEVAMHAYRRFPERVIIGVKRSMGDPWKTPPIDGKEYTPAEVSSEILRALKSGAEAFFGRGPVVDVVITVPAYFGPDQRRDTKHAAELAGLNAIRILDEPSAAALAFSIGRIEEIAGRNILVYDLGGGTFDVTLIHCEREDTAGGEAGLKIRTICKDGNRRLGGLNWDQELEGIVASRCQDEHEHDPRIDPADNAQLVEQCERGKRFLSEISPVDIAADLRGHIVSVTQEEFEEQTDVWLGRTRQLIEGVLDTAANPDEKLRQRFADILPLNRDRIELLLCGGATKMPAVQRLVADIMGRAPLQFGNPELMVVTGAAYYAYLAGERAIPTYDEHGNQTGVVTLDPGDVEGVVRPVSVEVQKDPSHPELGTKAQLVIPGGATVGVVHRERFAAAHAGQMEVEIVLLEGDDPDVEKCVRLDSFRLCPNIPGRPAGWPIEVELKYDESGIIVGKAVDVERGDEIEIRFVRH